MFLICVVTGLKFNRTAFPCLFSPPGVHADILIYKFGKTYVSTVPMFNNGNLFLLQYTFKPKTIYLILLTFGCFTLR
jgi:hypothetical protein